MSDGGRRNSHPDWMVVEPPPDWVVVVVVLVGGGVGGVVRPHRQRSRDPSPLPSPSPLGMRGSRAERVSPQNLAGDSSFLAAVNFQPMWEPQFRH